MIDDYNKVVSVSSKDFEKAWKDFGFENKKSLTKTGRKDIRRMEEILDVREGVLDGIEYLSQPYNCKCGRKITFYDFVFTALIDGIHSKSFILHTLLGKKLVINNARVVRCSSCGTNSETILKYGMPSSYLCRDGDQI